MEMALFSSQRETNDVDFIFVPFNSKKKIAVEIEDCLKSMNENMQVTTELSSKNARFRVKRGEVLVNVEVSIDMTMPSIPLNTTLLARELNIQPQIIRVMKPEIALAHKIAAWNERRLLRDLYDIYFWYSIQKVEPDLQVLERRLSRIESRVAELKHVKKMTLATLSDELVRECQKLTAARIERELPMVPSRERLMLEVTLASQIKILSHFLI
jgi:predicted nucleotidyltransferase component of viral defense system